MGMAADRGASRRGSESLPASGAGSLARLRERLNDRRRSHRSPVAGIVDPIHLELPPIRKGTRLGHQPEDTSRGPGDRRRPTVNVGARRRKLPVWPLLLALAAGCDAETVAVEPYPLPPPGQWEANPRPVAVTVGPVDGDPLCRRGHAPADGPRDRPIQAGSDGPRRVGRGSARRGGGGFSRPRNGPGQRDGGGDGHGGRRIGLGNRDGGAGARGVTPIRIFISSVQREFAREREQLRDFLWPPAHAALLRSSSL